MNIPLLAKFQFILFAIFIFSGCSVASGNTWTDLSHERKDAQLDKIERNISSKSDEAKSFMGKRKADLIAYYGEPSEVNYNVGKYNSATKKSDYYEEELVYKFKKGTRFINENSYNLIFYLNNDIVENFKVFGVPF